MSPDSRLVLLCGLPYAGKSTFARDWVQTFDPTVPIVCPDEIREAVHGERFLRGNEPHIWWIARVMVRTFFLGGHPLVVLDATSTTRARRKEWLPDRRAGEQWILQARVFRTPADECIRRARSADDLEIQPVIERMAHQWEEPDQEHEPYLEHISFEPPPIALVREDSDGS